MSSTQLCPLAERQNINVDSGSGGGGSQQAGPVGLLFNAPNLLHWTARTEELGDNLEAFLLQTRLLQIDTLMSVVNT